MKTINGIIHNKEFRIKKLEGLIVNKRNIKNDLIDCANIVLSTSLIVYWVFYFLSEYVSY